jgi:hypothetical protein
MAGGVTFAAVLDDKLRGSKPEPAATPEPCGRHVPTVQAFVFEFAAAAGNMRNPRATHLYSIDSELSRSGAQPTGFGRARDGHERPSSRPQRILSSRQRAALDQLNALGAAIGADVTVQELRQAFRVLARLYHPDRHPDSSAIERARLSRQFVQLHDAYRELQPGTLAAA